MPTTKPPLFPSQEKIKRAKAKFSYLMGSINNYIRSNPYSIRKQTYGDRFYVIASRDKDIPEDVSFEVVELVYHLRTALDKMMVALVARNERGTSGVGFPFGGMSSNGEPEQFPTKRMEDGIKKKLTTDQWALIEAQRPYPGGNDTLWAINELSNEDKHRKDLVEALADPGASVDITRLEPSSTVSIGINNPAVIHDQEREVVLFSTDLARNKRIDSTISPAVVFGPIPPVQGQNVLVTLNQQIRLVEGIVGVFRQSFF